MGSYAKGWMRRTPFYSVKDGIARKWANIDQFCAEVGADKHRAMIALDPDKVTTNKVIGYKLSFTEPDEYRCVFKYKTD